MADRVFTAGQIAKVSGAPYHVVDRWAKNGILTPSIGAGRGCNACRAYSERDLFVATVLNGLRQSQLEGKVIRRTASYLSRPGTGDQQLMFIGQRIIREGSQQASREIVCSYPGPVIVVDLALYRRHCERESALLVLPNRGKASLVAK